MKTPLAFVIIFELQHTPQCVVQRYLEGTRPQSMSGVDTVMDMKVAVTLTESNWNRGTDLSVQLVSKFACIAKVFCHIDHWQKVGE